MGFVQDQSHAIFIELIVVYFQFFLFVLMNFIYSNRRNNRA
jgi:hypothetical protein